MTGPSSARPSGLVPLETARAGGVSCPHADTTRSQLPTLTLPAGMLTAVPFTRKYLQFAAFPLMPAMDET